ncbi:hypothetical protein EVAR_17361_1 [Eumeta japonica]|uniref:Uncharacterized protein n=1 Tax=Eumeta variegata TaxID=151549 RepID=A0A4C1WGX9_EUMVA|nr:hypothetical protein EVAR_17361_1 [Eumeta japonica]
MGNKKNKRKRARLRHIETVRDNGRKTAAKRWSEHNKDIDEATSTTSNALETSSQHSTMDCVDDENGMFRYMELHSFACVHATTYSYADTFRQMIQITLKMLTAVCSGIVATGIGYSQLEEICSAMDVPIFTEKYFAKVQVKYMTIGRPPL